jgi:pimeloyl-ACP methyl ester carboxylesterase
MRAEFEYLRAFPADAEQNRESAKAKIPMPVLVMGGDIYPTLVEIFQGTYFALSSTQALAANVTGITVPRSGHWILDEQLQFVMNQLFNFIGNSNNGSK